MNQIIPFTTCVTLLSRCLKPEPFIFTKNVNAGGIPLSPNCCVELPSLLFLRGASVEKWQKEAESKHLSSCVHARPAVDAVDAVARSNGAHLGPSGRGHSGWPSHTS